MTDETLENPARSLSLRDPAGALFEVGEELIRLVYPEAESEFKSTIDSKTMRGFVDSGDVIGHWKVKDPKKYSFLLSSGFPVTQEPCLIAQTKLPFVNYPHEWSPEMLREAGKLTLELAEKFLAEGLGLKDATPYNVLYDSCKPVFVDILSVERRSPLDSLWIPYSQFLRCFINPLLLQSHFGVPISKTFLLMREGVTPQEVYRHCSFVKRISFPFLHLATVPTLLEKMNQTNMKSSDRSHQESSPEKAAFILGFLLKRLRKTLLSIPRSHKSIGRFSTYMKKELPYTPQQFNSKETFIKTVLSQITPVKLLDIGCNDGHFSVIAAAAGAQVVAVDSEPELIDRVWQQNRNSGLKILPLVVNVANPSPAMGWNNEEQKSFLSRSEGRFDTVMMLALLHHLIATEGIPLKKIIELAARLTTQWLIIEWIAPQDPMFAKVGLGKDFEYLSQEVFEETCLMHFEIIHHHSLPDSLRKLYLLKKRKIQ